MMEAGRELNNALVAKEVMGWVMHPTWGCLAPLGYPNEEEMWTPWEWAWDEGEQDVMMTRQPIKGKLVPGVVMDGSGKPKVPDYLGSIAAAWQVVEKVGMQCGYHVLSHKPFAGYDGEFTFAETVPLAICLAALKAVGAEHG